jgi:hypothetical protein
MTLHRLGTRVQRLEQYTQTQEAGVLHVWRLPEESPAEAFARDAVDPDDVPRVQVHVWPGAQVTARLGSPLAPCWLPMHPPALATLEHRLLEGMKEKGCRL